MTAQLTHRGDDGRIVVEVSGELDFTSVAAVTDELERLLAGSSEPLVLDLSGTTFLDSAGINLLFELRAALHGRGQELVLVVPRENLIHRTLELTGADASLAIRPSLDEGADDPPRRAG